MVQSDFYLIRNFSTFVNISRYNDTSPWWSGTRHSRRECRHGRICTRALL